MPSARGIGVVTATSSAPHTPPLELGGEGHVGNRLAERRRVRG